MLWSGAFLALPVLRASGATDCGINRRLGAPLADAPLARLEGLQCDGYISEHNCCDALPMQRLLVYIAGSIRHHAEQVQSFENMLGGVDSLLQSVAAPGGAERCIGLLDALLRAQRDTALSLAKHARAGYRLVEHLVMSTLCEYCVAEDPSADFRISLQDGPVARELGMVSVFMHVAQQALRSLMAELLASDGDESCLPGYIATLLQGVEVGIPIGVTSLRPEGQGVAVNLAVESIARLREWPLRRQVPPHAAASSRIDFDKDFIELADRLLAFLLGPGGRLAHQMQVLVSALERRFFWQSDSSVGLLWSQGMEEAWSDALDLHTDNAGRRIALHAVLPTAGLDTDDPGAAFGLVVLISNRTAGRTIKALLTRLEGPRTLLLEDTCGTAVEALGYGCHSGGKEQSTCLRPKHVSIAQRLMQSYPVTRRPLFAWRRHTASRSVARSARELATWYWGHGSPVTVADLRSEGVCTPGYSLEADIASLPESSMLHVAKDPEALFDTQREHVDPVEEARDPEAWNSGGFAEDVPMDVRLAEYIEFHREGVATLKLMQASPGQAWDLGFNVLVYSCQPFAQCGGHGDRINGIVTMFMLAVLTRRLFLLDLESPVPLQMLLVPSLVDWRVRGGILATAGLQHHSYHDKRQQFEADIGRLASYPDQLLVVSGNYRMLRSLFEAPELRRAAAALGLPYHAPPFLVADLFDILFRPSSFLARELRSLRARAGGLEEGRFIAIHLRTGEVAWDPARHGSSELSEFLRCAKDVEDELGLPADTTPWLLATDSAEVARVAAELPEALSGKLRIPEAEGRIHIERSGFGEVIDGAAANYAEWIMFSKAAAVVLSRSFFGETAAEIGRVRHAFFAPDGACVRTDLTSS